MDVRKIRRYQYCSEWDNENKPIITTTDSLNEARSNYKYVYRGQDAGEVDGWTHELVDDMLINLLSVLTVIGLFP